MKSAVVIGTRCRRGHGGRSLLAESIAKGAILKTDCEVTRLGIDSESNTVSTVYAKEKGRQTTYSADLIVLVAGGIETPIILDRSGISCENTLFIDPVLCVAAKYKDAGHPGGMLPLTSEEAESFHNPRLPENLYVADASLLPESLGNPPIYTILALAKRVAKVCIATMA